MLGTVRQSYLPGVSALSLRLPTNLARASAYPWRRFLVRSKEATIEGDLSQELLDESLLNLGPAARFLSETDSTNRVAIEWAGEGAPERSIVVADFQTAGRGRMGRSWFAPRGSCLLFSVILRPNIATDDVPFLNLAAASATASALSRLEFDPRFKWPNDVTLSGKKVCGILAESEIEVGRAVSVVLGVGINVSVRHDDFPEEIRGTATSLVIEREGDYNRLEILGAFATYLSELYTAIGDGHHGRILELYKPLCETLGRKVRIEMGERILEGTAVDIDATGGLVLDSGEVIRSGEVVHLR